MDEGDLSFVFLSFIMKACPPIRAYSYSEHGSIGWARTNGIAATWKHLGGRYASSNSQLVSIIMSIQTINAT